MYFWIPFGRLDIIVNNAALIIVSPSSEVSADDLIRAFRVNLVGAVIASREAAVVMKIQGGGHILADTAFCKTENA